MTNTQKTKVLIIDDNNSILEYLKTVLKRYDFNIKTCTNGYDGLQEVAQFKPEIVFLDLMMPNLDGLQLLQLKKVLIDIKDIPVIVISANAGRNNVMAAIEAGADRVLAKPINIRQLKSAIDELLGGSFFDHKNDEEVYQDKDFGDQKLSFREKFYEHKEFLIAALRNRDADSVKSIITLLKSFTKECNNNQIKILFEIGKRIYSKPSDWMFAEIKIKELEKLINEITTKI